MRGCGLLGSSERERVAAMMNEWQGLHDDDDIQRYVAGMDHASGQDWTEWRSSSGVGEVVISMRRDSDEILVRLDGVLI